ncbi:MAG: ABC transporter permease [Acidobacteria bacterium]|nr:ABC transporter permease [Acidobacteriota bacterium]
MARPPLALLAGLAACAAAPFLIAAAGVYPVEPATQEARTSADSQHDPMGAPGVRAVARATQEARTSADSHRDRQVALPALLPSSDQEVPAAVAAPASEREAGPPSILVSRQLAAAEGLRAGDVVHFSTEPSGAGARPFRIAGTYEPTPDPMRVMSARHEARFHLPDLLALGADPDDPLGEESVDAINVALADPAGALVFASDLRAQVPGLLIEPTARDTGPSSTFAVIERFHFAVAVVTVVASSLFLLALMVMRVNERRETLGTLRLIGVPRRRLALHVVAEGLAVAVAGTLFGLLLAVAFEGVFNRFFQWRYDTALTFVRITPSVAWRSVALAVPTGLLASVAASWPLLRAGALTLVRR